MLGHKCGNVLRRPGLEGGHGHQRRRRPPHRPRNDRRRGRAVARNARLSRGQLAQRVLGKNKGRNQQRQQDQQPQISPFCQQQAAQQRPGQKAELPKEEEKGSRRRLAPGQLGASNQRRLADPRRVEHPRTQVRQNQQRRGQADGQQNGRRKGQSNPDHGCQNHAPGAPAVSQPAKNRLRQPGSHHRGRGDGPQRGVAQLQGPAQVSQINGTLAHIQVGHQMAEYHCEEWRIQQNGCAGRCLWIAFSGRAHVL